MISLSEAFQSEILFALRFWIQTKPVHIASTSSGGSSSSSSSSKSSKSTKSSASSSTSSKRSKHSSKSYAHSFSHSSKSVTNDKHDQEKDRLSVHDKLRKISSMFSLKSARSEPSVNNVHLEAQPALNSNAHHPNNHNYATIRKSTQMVREVAQQTTPISDEQSDEEEEKEQQQQQEEVEEQPVEQSAPQPHHHHHHHHHHRHHNHNHNHNHNHHHQDQQPDGDQPDMQLIERTQNGKVSRNGYAGFGNAEV